MKPCIRTNAISACDRVKGGIILHPRPSVACLNPATNCVDTQLIFPFGLCAYDVSKSWGFIRDGRRSGTVVPKHGTVSKLGLEMVANQELGTRWFELIGKFDLIWWLKTPVLTRINQSQLFILSSQIWAPILGWFGLTQTPFLVISNHLYLTQASQTDW